MLNSHNRTLFSIFDEIEESMMLAIEESMNIIDEELEKV